MVSIVDKRGVIEKSVLEKGYFVKRHLIGPWVPRQLDSTKRWARESPFASKAFGSKGEVEPTDRKSKTLRGPPIKKWR